MLQAMQNRFNPPPEKKAMDAAFSGNLNEVKTYIETAPDRINAVLLPTTPDYIGETLLTKAIKGNQLEVIQFLISKGADVNTVCKDAGNKDITPLMVAVASRASVTNVIIELIKAGAKVNFQVFKLLLEDSNIAKLNYVLSDLLDTGFDVNTDLINDEGSTTHLLQMVFHQKQLGAIPLLLQRGATLRLTDDFPGTSPLMLAVMAGQDHLVEELLAAGADIEAKNTNEISSPELELFGSNTQLEHVHSLKKNETALMWAVRCNHLEMTKLLLTKGAKVDLAEMQAAGIPLATLLFAAIALDKKELVNELVASGVDVNSKLYLQSMSPYHTPLTYALKYNRIEMITLLLGKGANPDDAFHFILTTNEEDLNINLLLENLVTAGFNINSSCYLNNGLSRTTPLIRLIKNPAIVDNARREEAILKLLQLGADANMADEDGNNVIAVLSAAPHIDKVHYARLRAILSSMMRDAEAKPGLNKLKTAIEKSDAAEIAALLELVGLGAACLAPASKAIATKLSGGSSSMWPPAAKPSAAAPPAATATAASFRPSPAGSR